MTQICHSPCLWVEVLEMDKVLRDMLRMLRTISSDIESRWKRQQSGWELILCFICLLAFWHWDIPAPGKAVAALALAAAIMSFRTDLRGLEKFFWLSLLIAFLWLEFTAIDKDRDDNAIKTDQHFQAIIANSDREFKSTMGKSKTLLDTTQSVSNLTNKNLMNITGGTSFAYLRPQVEGAGKGPVALAVWNNGNEILTGVTITISRTNDPNWAAEFFNPYSIGTIAPHDFARLPVAITPHLTANGLDHYWVMISAQNGTVDETVDFKDSKKFPETWAVRIRVSKRVKINAQSTIFPLLMVRGWSDEPGSDESAAAIRKANREM